MQNHRVFVIPKGTRKPSMVSGTTNPKQRVMAYVGVIMGTKTERLENTRFH